MSQKIHYLLIGRGRVAHHFQHYFTALNLSFETWDRSQDLVILEQRLQKASHVLLLVSDSAIDTLAQRCLDYQTTAILLHCSGSLHSKLAYGAHPLMTFTQDLYKPEQYKEIAFIIDQNASDFANLLPGLPNPHARLDPLLKAQYHALCVMSGNFSCLLWQKLLSTLKSWNISPDLAMPFLKQQTANLMKDYTTALTGPLVRGDTATLEKNSKALDSDPYQDIYKSFVRAYEIKREQ
jgi:predicted short-subunit dehydrogenase-like oxidoreductase (DUF2520 family)